MKALLSNKSFLLLLYKDNLPKQDHSNINFFVNFRLLNLKADEMAWKERWKGFGELLSLPLVNIEKTKLGDKHYCL